MHADRPANAGYFRYWGKAHPIPGSDAAWHPLVYHSLDVAAVGVALLERDDRLRRRLTHIARLDDAAVLRWAFLSLALHDVGKFAPFFQSKAHDIFAKQFGPEAWSGTETRHDFDGLVLWHRHAKKDTSLQRAFSKTATGPHPLTRVSAWISAAICHHGRPVNSNDIDDLALKARYRSEHLSDIDAYLGGVLKLAAGIGLAPESELPDQSISSWLVSGISVMSDWIGSNQHWFMYQKVGPDLSEYWALARSRADVAIHNAGVVPARAAVSLSLADFLPRRKPPPSPSPLQHEAATLPLAEGPQLFILEDQTGSGKTEAALILAGRMIGAGLADGAVIALPTMATANAMYERCEALYRIPFAPDDEPSIVLAHSRRDLVLKQPDLGGRASEPDYEANAKMETASAACARWLADDRRKSALADFGVATVDQAVMAVLPSRFQSLRLAGLARKALIIDEVHAYDAYLGTLIRGLLHFHAALGGSAILLSATLPASQREEYVASFNRGLQQKPVPVCGFDDHYPSVTHSHQKRSYAVPVSPRPALERKLHFEFLATPADAAELALREARAGRAVAWVRNSVADAMEAYFSLRGRWDKTSLFHARFAMCDRLDRERDVLRWFGVYSTIGEREGRILIATQVIEQSLDLDFDAMVSDLAPIDLLIQRAGRLWRHARPGRDGDPVLHLVSPDPAKDVDAHWYARMFKRGARVYGACPGHAKLWLTAVELKQRGALCLPRDTRSVIEAVYGTESASAIPELLERRDSEAEAHRYSRRAIADTSRLKLEAGYIGSAGLWQSDTVIPTRLGEPQSQLRLARWQDGVLRPWDERGSDWRAWRMSEVMVMQYYVTSVPQQRDKSLAKSMAETRTGWPERDRDSLLVALLPKDQDGSIWRGQATNADGRLVELEYSLEFGLAIRMIAS